MIRNSAVLAACALPFACARVVAPVANVQAGPSTLQLTDILEKAVVLMEKGTEKLVQDARIQEARLSSTAGSVGAAEAQENVAAMQKILKDFRSLHLIAEKLHGRYTSESQQLEADRDDKGSLLAVAQSRTKTLERDNADLQAMLKDEMKNTNKCAKELRSVQNTTNTCDAVRAKDAGTIKHLMDKSASLEEKLNATQAEMLSSDQRLNEANDKLSSQVMETSKENAELKSQVMALQARLNTAEAIQKTLNATVQDYSQKIALDKDQREDVEEERQSEAEAFKELNASFVNAEHQLAVKQEELLTEQKALDIANNDKNRLLDSVRMLMHQNDEFQRRLLSKGRGVPLGSPEPDEVPPQKRALGEAPHAAAAASAPVLAGRRASNGTVITVKYDNIEWMNKTRKIDEYLSRLSPSEAEAQASEASAPTPPPAPLAPMLTDYLGMKQAEVKEASKEMPVVERSISTTVTATAAPIARYLRATTTPAASAGGQALSSAAAAKQQARAKQDEEELASMKDIQEANTLYSEAERLIQSASD